MTDYGSTWHKSPEAERIEQAIARYGTPHKAAEKTGYPLGKCLAVYRRMEQAAGAGDQTLYRRPAVRKHPCGTYPAYQFHTSHGEPLDDACRAIGNATRRVYARRSAERRSMA